MDSDEIRISKVADDLLLQIDNQLTIILQETDNANDNVNPSPQSLQTTNQKTTLNSILKAIDEFQLSPQLLDTKLRHFVTRIIDAYSLKCLDPTHPNKQLEETISLVFYSLAKVRGIKTISNCLTSDIYLISFILQKLDDTTWQGRFFLLVWLSVLILAPFPLIKINRDLPETVYELSTKFLESVGNENQASSILMARFLSRNDSVEYLDRFVSENFNSIAWDNKSEYNKTGTLYVLNFMLKIAKSSSIVPFAARILTLISNEVVEEKNTNIVRMHLKVLGKLSVVFDNYENYSAVEDILNCLFGFTGHSDTVIRYCSAKQIAKLSHQLPIEMRTEIVQFLVTELEINNLKLSSDLLSIQADLKVDFETVDVEKYHGVLLTLGEFARQRQLDSPLIYLAVSILEQTFTSQKNSTLM
ncbi:unnamed protein product [Ambrosiozyma monospora]|uniref:Unnamed protein product n=1 Tax=Ambrosiozyma monospora TaxID=43982 RepID=A0ACB5T5C6_AMBMO|nr:unnamed protein product [Ambrosiozyma monospora]